MQTHTHTHHRGDSLQLEAKPAVVVDSDMWSHVGPTC